MSSSEMKAYWETNVVGQFSPYKKYADDLNKSVIFPDIIDRFVNSDDDSFEIDSLEGDIALRLRKARCFMFIKCFKDFFGKGQKPLLMNELEWYNSQHVYDKFLSPKALEDSWKQRHHANPKKEIPSYSDSKSATDKFCWLLKYDMPGKFIWRTSASTTFREWLGADQPMEQNLLPSCALINCWEMAFYAAIRAGLMKREILMPAYEENVNEPLVLDSIFAPQMVKCLIKEDKVTTAPMADSKPYALKVGDIVVVDTFLEERGKDLEQDESGKFYHVAAVVDVGQAGDDLANIKVTSLWDAPPTTAIHSIKPILLALDDNEENRGDDKRGTKTVPWFRILRLGA